MLADEIETARAGLEEGEAQIQVRQDEYADAARAIEQLDATMRRQRQELTGWHDRRASQEVREAQSRLRQENLHAQTLAQYQVDLAEFPPDFPRCGKFTPRSWARPTLFWIGPASRGSCVTCGRNSTASARSTLTPSRSTTRWRNATASWRRSTPICWPRRTNCKPSSRASTRRAARCSRRPSSASASIFRKCSPSCSAAAKPTSRSPTRASRWSAASTSSRVRRANSFSPSRCFRAANEP